MKRRNIMFCKYCGKQIDDDVKFCPYCGKAFKDSNTADNIKKISDVAKSAGSTIKESVTNKIDSEVVKDTIKKATNTAANLAQSVKNAADEAPNAQDPKTARKNTIIGLIVVCLAVILLFKGCGAIFGGGKYSSELKDAKTRISNEATLRSTKTGASVKNVEVKEVSHKGSKCIIMASYDQSGTRSGTNYILYFYDDGEYIDSSGSYVHSKSDLNIKEYEKQWY